ncbi:hypothetical protein KQX54_004724 [Cotesia glomerata]|uniref:Uncharacterized protein n=1 Tax=Cotesia glomerata TaxID=32391 RepID=A0AAV7IJL5_COTGL|nr:hypothetical protein KQX54_004724 [Cotesia glomerata]
MHAGDYAWILPGETIDMSGMTRVSGGCSPSQLTQTLNGLIIVNSYGRALSQELSSSGLEENWKHLGGKDFGGNTKTGLHEDFIFTRQEIGCLAMVG